MPPKGSTGVLPQWRVFEVSNGLGGFAYVRAESMSAIVSDLRAASQAGLPLAELVRSDGEPVLINPARVFYIGELVPTAVEEQGA